MASVRQVPVETVADGQHDVAVVEDVVERGEHYWVVRKHDSLDDIVDAG